MKLSREGKLELRSRIAISLIGALVVLGITMQSDNFNFGLMLFLLLFIAVSVGQ